MKRVEDKTVTMFVYVAVVYGITTGFGKFARTVIDKENLV